MTQLLISEPPLQVLPSLAVHIGLNEAIIIQQLHYWSLKSRNKRDGRVWVYKTLEDWKLEFPFWSDSTIRRTIKGLEDNDLLISTDQYNKIKSDRTKWYSVNYDKIRSKGPVQNEQVEVVNLNIWPVQNEHLVNHRIPPENTTERENVVTSVPSTLCQEVIDYLNDRAKRTYKSTTKKTKSLIQARAKEGFTLDDFKKVIDNKVATWLDDEKMDPYLRPDTLFGTKFEGYLNEKVTNVKPKRQTMSFNELRYDEDE